MLHHFPKYSMDNVYQNKEWELGVVVSELGSQSKVCGFEKKKKNVYQNKNK